MESIFLQDYVRNRPVYYLDQLLNGDLSMCYNFKIWFISMSGTVDMGLEPSFGINDASSQVNALNNCELRMFASYSESISIYTIVSSEWCLCFLILHTLPECFGFFTSPVTSNFFTIIKFKLFLSLSVSQKLRVF